MTTPHHSGDGSLQRLLPYSHPLHANPIAWALQEYNLYLSIRSLLETLNRHSQRPRAHKVALEYIRGRVLDTPRQAMPPNNNANGTTTPLHKHKQSVPGRIVPAIPLTLTKPKAPRHQHETTSHARAGIQSHSTQDAAATLHPISASTTMTIEQSNEHRTISSTKPQPSGPKSANADDVALTVNTPGSRGSAAMSVSTGDTPELPESAALQPQTPPVASASSPTITMTPLSSRKPTDKFDMRQIRTELPPAFVPSAERLTPQSAASTGPRAHQSHPHAHPNHTSTNGIVFGGPDSATSSPAPPQPAGFGIQPPQYPIFASTQPPYFVPMNHAHHASEPFAPRTHHPSYMQSHTPWSTRQGHVLPSSHAPSLYSHSYSPFRYPPREVFTPSESQQPNGFHARSRSVSQASSAAFQAGDDPQSPTTAQSSLESSLTAARDAKSGFPAVAHVRQQPQNHTMAMQSATMSHPDIAANFENAETLRNHIFSQFSNPVLADCHLQIQEETGGQHYLDCHRVILSRSPTLLELIQNNDPPASAKPKTQVHVQLKGGYVSFTSFMDALRYLYGGRLLPLDQTRWSENSGISHQQRVDMALKYIATGTWLKVPAIAFRGVDVTASLLHWDTLATALVFALDGGLSQVWSIDDGSEDKFSCSSSDDSWGRSETTPTYDPYATQLLHRILHFVVQMFPHNFYLDASAPELKACLRLPSLPIGHDSRPSRSDPRLSQIRFGEMSIEDHQRPSPITTTISSLLLSLPFALLKCLLEHFDLVARLGPDTVASIMRQVVAERETRRTKALKARTHSGQDDTQLVQNLYWEESVEPSNQLRAGFRLARKRRGIDTPPSSGAESERSKEAL